MKETENHPNEALQIFSGIEAPQDLPQEIVKDALSIVIDAINSTVGGLIITDLDGNIRFANPSFCRMFEYSLKKILVRTQPVCLPPRKSAPCQMLLP